MIKFIEEIGYTAKQIVSIIMGEFSMKSKSKISALDVANYFIDGAIEQKENDVTNLKLQKLCFFAQVWSIVSRGIPLFDEDFLAWPYGPGLQSVYDIYKKYEKKPIDKIYGDYHIEDFSDEEFKILMDVEREYGKYSANKLTDISHVDGGPWDIVYKPHTRHKILKENIKRFYSNKENLEQGLYRYQGNIHDVLNQMAIDEADQLSNAY